MQSPIRSSIVVLALLIIGGVAIALRGRVPNEDGVAPAAGDAASASRSTALLDSRRQQLIGVRTARASRGTLKRSIRTGGAVAYDETRLTDVNLKLDGWITELYISHVGEPVSRGQSLFKVYSPDLLSAQNDLIVALRNRDQAAGSPGADGREYAVRLIEAPRQRLVRWDVPEDQLTAISEGRQVLPSIIFRSPAAGVVIEKSVIKGMQVKTGQTLFRIADLSAVWVEAEFRELDLSQLSAGAPAAVSTDAWPEVRLSGRVVHVFPYMNEQTRTVKARIGLANRAGRLKPGMFVNVDLETSPQEGLIVPADAVIDSGTRQTVFVAQGDGHYEPRAVTVGARAEGKAVIVQGLRENEYVAERATFFLDSESQLRGGLQSYEAPASPPAVGSSPGTLADDAQLDVSVSMSPDPPRTGENTVFISVKDQDGRPVADAQVRALFTMPPMPAMNMPAMRAESQLQPDGNGRFRGAVSLSMPGRWDVTVTLQRHGRAIVTKRSSVLAR
jgi:Cu(I)/Ag(I) efflux system membrane fusion protein/cobalt-zinc-cadmium efflux system membrane fusion protein